MRNDFGDLVIDEAIVHLVPRSRKTDPVEAGIQLSDTVCELTGTVRTELQGKLRDVMARLGREVVEDPEAKSKLPEYVQDFLEDRMDLVEVSGEVAYLLRNSQSGVSPAGLLLVASARLDGHKALLMVKLEQETGMQANQIVTGDGRRTFSVEYFANLLFTEASRVYKVALFSEEGIGEDGLEGWAADKQMTGKALAAFFLKKFLGCRHKDEPREITRRFHDAAVGWINSRITDPDTRVQYLMAVLVELQSTAMTLNPAVFINTHLKLPHREDFACFLREQGLPARATFDKDTELIDTRLSKVRVEFANGVFLVAPLDAVGETIAIEDLGGGHTSVTVTGTVTSTSSFASGGRPSKKGDTKGEPQAGA
ncbi:nucleoid-associated protein [Kitasatospora sp. NPDC059327]|uniref:nucleoid-associated protein n=1 Tax=Kitasatospora sp. NPDC059327 TaxID=3346803 RepID=UPI0036C18ADD